MLCRHSHGCCYHNCSLLLYTTSTEFSCSTVITLVTCANSLVTEKRSVFSSCVVFLSIYLSIYYILISSRCSLTDLVLVCTGCRAICLIPCPQQICMLCGQKSKMHLIGWNVLPIPVESLRYLPSPLTKWTPNRRRIFLYRKDSILLKSSRHHWTSGGFSFCRVLDSSSFQAH